MNCIKILSLILFVSCIHIAFAQQGDAAYKKQWNIIDSLIVTKNASKTALQKVKDLYAEVKKKNQSPQIIKCLLYRIDLENKIQDDKPLLAIQLTEKELNENNSPEAKSILHCLLANKYLEYYNNNRWKLYQRSTTINYNKKDMETWNAKDFGKSISSNYLQSIADAEFLKGVKLSAFEAIIVKGNDQKLRPTLYDLLAHEALDYFKTDDYGLRNAGSDFTLNDLMYLSPVSNFKQYHFNASDYSSYLLLSLKLFQQLISFHSQDKDLNALVDIDLERLQWVHEYMKNEKKEQVYKTALQDIINTYNCERTAQAYYLLASIESENAGRYKPFTDTAFRYSYVNAMNIIKEALPKYPTENEGTANLKNLRNSILKKELSTVSEKVNIPDKPFRTLVTYRNMDKLFVRVIKLSGKEKLSDNLNENVYWKRLAGLKVYSNYIQPLPQTNDHQNHSVEIKIDALPVGEYALLCSSGEHFIDSLDKLCVQYLYVSNISHIYNNTDHFVLNRETGEPLQNVKVVITKEKDGEVYGNPRKITLNDIVIAVYNTDAKGHFSFVPKEDYNYYRFSFFSATDALNLNTTEYLSHSSSDEDKKDLDKDDIRKYEEDAARFFFFLDRSIYRPGQTVYFKGIAVTKDYKTKNSKILAEKDSIKIYLQDANNKKIDSLLLKINAYGSFSGNFKLPQNGLTRRFHISADDFRNSSVSFSVEEYKRPKFYVEFEKPKGAYRINDSITVTGYAKAYAGNAIDAAKVKFTVNRYSRFIYDWYWRGGSRPGNNNNQISAGEITTDALGKFSVTFKAIPDEDVDKNSNPQFDFSINADVTDLNGETRTAKTQITVAYKSLVLSVNAPALSEADSLKQILINTTNLSKEPEPAVVNVKIYPLKTPVRLIRERYWEQPDQYIFDKDSYTTYFPNDDYADELNKNKWKENAFVFESNIQTKETNKLLLTSLPAGYYKIEATAKDKDGNEVKDIKYIQLFDRKTTPYPQYNFNYTVNDFAEPNELARFLTGSMADKIFVIQTTQKRYHSTYEIVTRTAGLKELNYTATEEDRGGISIVEAFIKHNRYYTNSYEVNVPWSNKDLQVIYSSYRNKTEPGNKEKWTVQIKTDKNEKAAAELLTSMYDASLDQFRTHSWESPRIWNKNENYNAFVYKAGFTTVDAMPNYLVNNYEYSSPIYYPYLAKRCTDFADYKAFYHLDTIETYDLKGNITGYEIKKKNVGETRLMRAASGITANDFVMAEESIVVGATAQKQEISSRISTADITMTPKQKINKIKSLANVSDVNVLLVIIDDSITIKKYSDLDWATIDYIEVINGDMAIPVYGSKASNGVILVYSKGKKQNKKPPVQPRKNFNETAFFFPQLYADSAGNYSFRFTMPESLTQWKWLSFAHTKDLAMGLQSANIITQKTLMVQPNPPRFLREGDIMELTVKVSNMSDKELKGQLQLQLSDAETNVSVDGLFNNVSPNQYFTVAAKQSTVVKFPVRIPLGFTKPLNIKTIATADQYSDGEENIVPVLSKNILVTESLPLYLKPGETQKEFHFDKLINNKSETLTNESFTVEYSSNPVWAAFQSLPYLAEFPHECAEQSFNRLYGYAIANYILQNNPVLKNAIQQIQKDTLLQKQLQSSLQKNQELKQLLLEETPWVLDAEKETAQLQKIAVLFNEEKIESSINNILEKIKLLQLPDGAFCWFSGGRANRYITQYIITGFGKLKKLNAIPDSYNASIDEITKKAIDYLDKEFAKEYDELKKSKIRPESNYIGYDKIQYFYMRSFYANYNSKVFASEAYNFYFNQFNKQWTTENVFMQALMAMSLNRFASAFKKPEQFRNTASIILQSLKENSIEDSLGGLHWKNERNYYWYSSPIEMHAAIAEAFDEITHEDNTVNKIKTWLILNKQTNNWSTTIATADACYVLLKDRSWFTKPQQISITAGNKQLIDATDTIANTTGYIKKKIKGGLINSSTGNINISIIPAVEQNTSTKQSPSFGAAYWQYFEEIDKITEASVSALSIHKKLFIEKNTGKEKLITPVSENDELKVGDKLIVRIELKSAKDMEYLHLKDSRASCTEPLNVLSSYKWQDGLGYYEATKDASTNFFIDYLPKGTYVFEYPLFVTHAGTFSVGLANIQCMYAPEFAAHSNGLNIKVRE